jgi:AcrR family transcriptional regulator
VTQTAAPDRRAALKARHRQAILDAADALILERGGPRFSVDELAERADVARRTIFNHFSSIDDVVLTASSQVLAVLTENFAAAAAASPVGDGSRAAMFQEIAATFRSSDLPHAISYLWSALGGADSNDSRMQPQIQEAFGRTSEALAGQLSRRNSHADPLDVELLVSSLMNGLVVMAMHWIVETGASTDPDSRAVWRDLLDRLIDSVQTGYMPER